MDKKQISSVFAIVLAITFIGASVASSKIKTLKKINAGSITNPYLANGAVNSAKIEDGTVSNADFADNSISTGKIEDGQVTNDDLATSAVSSGKISDGSITDSDLANGAVTSAKIAVGTVTNANVASNAAIAGTKVSPNFGSQNIATTGDVSATNGAGNFLRVTVGDVISGTGSGLYVDDDLYANGLQINPSGASSDSATGGTSPSETCNSDSWGSYEFVDDTDMVDGWLYICEQTGASSYAWKKMTL